MLLTRCCHGELQLEFSFFVFLLGSILYIQTSYKKMIFRLQHNLDCIFLCHNFQTLEYIKEIIVVKHFHVWIGNVSFAEVSNSVNLYSWSSFPAQRGAF